MTTIAYRSGVMAADSMVSIGNLVFGEMRKVARGPNGELAGASGEACDVAAALAWVEDGMTGQCPDLLQGTELLIAAQNGPVLFRDRDRPLYPIFGEFFALGSGSAIAMGAMAAGASAEEAVKIACRFDKGTGGEVQVIRHG